MDLHLFILSFNRGPYLKACVASAMAHLPGVGITVLDDGSTDPETVAVLNDLPVEVITPKAEQAGRHGGLYANMNYAVEVCAKPYLMFLQDDMQVVRDMGPEDWTTITEFLSADVRHAFVHPCFSLGKSKLRSKGEYRPWPPFRGYQNDNGAADQSDRSRRWVYDVVIADVGALRQTGFSFGPTERDNARTAAARFAPMLHYADPFACQLPQVATLRFGRRTLGARLSEYLTGPDPLLFHSLTVEEVAALKARDLTEIQMADDVLRTVNPKVRRPYLHKGVNARWYTRALNKLELLIRRRAT
ncbi:hypothetical protein ACMU_07265 [Actibacterium mucosum KCTC 23349]|uniref:Glycosyltransferase 2-like domain-containing protein n=1 Tax=Actibacterium mucosum KCTC 23349 TaxID=1454373 RepID=A0A037ZJV9_9RHOB|nr:glycosyltransferase family A protein [Actibacterium mucosum]KAJ56730.1 hypothetical protein ACMU_07265 [Actibacterium mucosum KCTC 23349]